MYYVIVIENKEQSPGRLFKSMEEAENWNEKYGYSGIIIEYPFDKEEANE